MDYTIINVDRKSEWRSSYAETPGNDMVDYAIALQGELGWVKLAQKISTAAPEVGHTITGRMVDEVSKNGKPYKKFKKESLRFSAVPTQQDSSKLEYIIQMLEELTGRKAPQETVALDEEDPFGGII